MRLVQTSNFSCAESNANELEQRNVKKRIFWIWRAGVWNGVKSDVPTNLAHVKIVCRRIQSIPWGQNQLSNSKTLNQLFVQKRIERCLTAAINTSLNQWSGINYCRRQLTNLDLGYLCLMPRPLYAPMYSQRDLDIWKFAISDQFYDVLLRNFTYLHPYSRELFVFTEVVRN